MNPSSCCSPLSVVPNNLFALHTTCGAAAPCLWEAVMAALNLLTIVCSVIMATLSVVNNNWSLAVTFGAFALHRVFNMYDQLTSTN